MLIRKVAAFTNVVLKVEQHVHHNAVLDVFPFAMAHGLLLALRTIHAPEKCSLLFRLRSGEDRHEVDAVELPTRRRLHTREREEGRGQVHGDGGLLRHLARRQMTGPAHEAIHTDAAFPKRSLVVEKRRVVGVTLPAIVAAEDDERIVRDPLLLQLREQHSDTVVDFLQHRSVGFTIAVIHVFFGDLRLGTARRLERRVNGLVGEVEEERFLRVLANKLDGVLVQQVSEVTARLHRVLALAQFVGAIEIFVAIVIRVAEQRAEVFVEAVPRGIELRRVAKMPLAKRASCVPGGLEHFRDARLACWKAKRMFVRLLDPLVAYAPELLGGETHGPLKSHALLPTAGDERATGWGADGGIGVEVGELHSLSREAVNVRRPNVLRAIAAEVRVTHVVHEDEDDVGFGGGGREAGKRRSEKQSDRRPQRRVHLMSWEPSQSGAFHCRSASDWFC